VTSVLLSVSQLAAGYGEQQVLFGVDLDVGYGEAVSLMGRNGMGKTTTVRAVMGLLPVSAGHIVFAGTAHRSAGASTACCPPLRGGRRWRANFPRP